MMKLATVGVVAVLAAGSMAFVRSGKEEAPKGDRIWCASMGHGCSGGSEGVNCGGGREDRVLERLDLTADQKARIEAIRASFRTENAATFKRIEALHTQMQEAYSSGDNDRIIALHTQMREAKSSLRPAMERMNQQIRAVLTSEQITRMEKRGRHGCRGRQENPSETSVPGNQQVVPELK
jgi:Spy/CpxP family protein refolding chaperone